MDSKEIKREYLKNIKEGDAVEVYNAAWEDPRNAAVSRVTETEIIAAGKRFCRRTGRTIGDYFCNALDIQIPRCLLH